MSNATEILSRIESGDPSAAGELLPLVYDELRKLAAAKIANEKPGQTLQATALVHEAYLRLVGSGRPATWKSRGHFFAAAAEAMRRILIERARQKKTLKEGGGQPRVAIDQIDIAVEPPSIDLLALNEALENLEQHDDLKAKLVKLRYFAGLTIPQAADALGISTSTADKYWAYAKCWLRLEMDDQADG